MNIKMLYMKLVGFVLVVTGFAYSLTSFYNFWSYLFGDIIVANTNVGIMAIGLIVPLYLFIFGVYFFFYADRDEKKINMFILGSAVFMLIAGFLLVGCRMDIFYTKFFKITQICELLHPSIGYSSFVFGILLVYGCIKYRY